MKFILFLVLMLVATFGCFSQSDWRQLIGNPDANFQEIQQSFYAEFGDSIGPKGSGWKQFKRWEYYNEQRLDENGNLPSSGTILNEMNAYYASHPEAKGYSPGTGAWEELGPVSMPNNGTGQPNGLGRLTSIAFHPTDANTIFVGAPAGGFWKTTDGGATWAQSITGLTRLGISSIVIHPTIPSTIFIGTGDRDGGDAPGYGVWKSTDGGATWAASNTGMGNRTVYEILMDPTNSNNLYASTNGNRLYRSTDGGTTWNFSTLSSNCKDIALKPGTPSTVYAVGTTFNVSTDSGVTFTQTTSGVPTGAQRFAMAVSADEPNWVYFVAGDGTGLIGVYRSTDSGANFTTQTTTPNILGYGVAGGAGSQAWYDLVMTAEPNDADKIYIGGINIWKSVDGGSTMTISSHWVGSGGIDDVHADQHVLEISPLNGILYSGNDGGIHYTTDEGVVWTEISSGLGIAQIYKIGVAQSAEGHVINGYQDNGTGIYYDGSWSTEIGGDGMECIIDPTDVNYMYGALYFGDIRRSTNGGLTFAQISLSITETGGWVTPYTLDPSDENRMYAGFDNVWRSDNIKAGTPTWNQISTFTGTSNMTDLAIAPSNSNIMYVSRALGGERFFRTANATAATPTWTNLSGSLPVNSTPKDIEIDPTDPNHLFIAIGNDIYESTDGGATWTNYSGTLPNISLNTIVIDHDSPVEAMYVGMDAGVYYRDNTLADWTSYSTGIPNVEITELEIYRNLAECRSKLYAATYGVGLWVSDLKDPGGLAPKVCFSLESTNVCGGSIVIFTDESDFGPTAWSWNITPATFTFTSGTNANSQHPEVQFSGGGTYTVELTATNANGTDILSKPGYITVYPATVASSFNEDFEAEAACGTASNCDGTTCPLSGLWTNLSSDDIDWRIDNGGTPSTGTGPSVDFNPGTAAGNYAYTEASSCFGREAILESDCILLDNSYLFEFGYHMSGSFMGEIHVDLYTGGSWVEDIIPFISGDQGNAWLTAAIDLSSYNGQLVRLRIRGITGGSFNSDMAIDDLAFTLFTPLPAEVVGFDAVLADKERVRIEWKTVSELNTDYFIVQRSQDGIQWKDMEKVAAAGISNDQIEYGTWDYSPFSGLSYYRLKAVDTDGTTSYSDVKTIVIQESEEIILYPNPANDFLIVEGKGVESKTLSVLSSLGQALIVQEVSETENVRQFNIAHLPSGVYFIRVTSEEHEEKVVRFTVE